jgi:hypothetical protein
MKNSLCILLLILVIPLNDGAGSYSLFNKTIYDSTHQEIDYGAQIDKEIWKPIIKSVLESDYETHAACYHPSAVVVMEMNNQSMTGKQWLENVKIDFAKLKDAPKSTYLKLRFDKRIFSSNTAFETGVYSYSAIDENRIRRTSYTSFESLAVRENGNWQIIMEHQKERVTIKEWENSGIAGEVE